MKNDIFKKNLNYNQLYTLLKDHRLSGREALCFFLKEYGEYSLKDISVELNISYNAVPIFLKRAKNKMK